MKVKQFVLGLVLVLTAVGPMWGAPSAVLKIGWMPAGSYSQMQYTTSGTVGSTVRLTVDVTYATSEGTYNITPKDLTFSESGGHPGQSVTFAAASLTITTLTDYPSQGQTTKRYQGIGHPTQQRHNGAWTAHSVAAWGWGKPMPPPGQQGTMALSDVTVTTRNLLVTDVKNGNAGGPEDCCLFDPEDPARNTIRVQYTLDDWTWGDARDTTNMTVEVYTSAQALVKTITATRTVPGTYTESWDGKNAQGQLMIQAGVYLFKVTAEQPSGNHHTYFDKNFDKSLLLTISQNGSSTAELISDDGTTAVYNVSYHLTDTDNVAASSGQIDVYDPELSKIFTRTLGTSDRSPGDHTVTVSMPSPEVAGDYVFLVGAKDDQANKEEGHRVKPALQHNQKKFSPATIAFSYGNYAMNGHARRFTSGVRGMNKMGYKRLPKYAWWYGNPLPSQVSSSMQKNHLWTVLFSGHGGDSGRQLCLYNNTTYLVPTQAYYNSHPALDSKCVIVGNLPSLQHVKLAVLIGCTMQDGVNTGGLADAFVGRGVQGLVVVGYDKVDAQFVSNWLEGPDDDPDIGFLSHLKKRETIAQAATASANEIVQWGIGNQLFSAASMVFEVKPLGQNTGAIIPYP